MTNYLYLQVAFLIFFARREQSCVRKFSNV